MLYDAEGSRLFAEICLQQPEYTLTQPGNRPVGAAR